MAAFHHLAHRAALHDLAQRLGLGIALGVIHAAPHIGVQTQVVVAHQHFTILQRGQLGLRQLEVALYRLARGAVVEKNLLVHGHDAFLEK